MMTTMTRTTVTSVTTVLQHQRQSVHQPLRKEVAVFPKEQALMFRATVATGTVAAVADAMAAVR